MGKKKKKQRPAQSRNPAPSPASTPPGSDAKTLWIVGGCLLVLGGILFVVLPNRAPAKPEPPAKASVPELPPHVGVPELLARPKPEYVNLAALPTMEINQAVMVTAELDFGPNIPTIAEALTQIERRSTPEDGQGRTFAILDAYGDPTPDGKLHISMHVSTEKPGVAALVFDRTDEYLWHSRIIAGDKQVQPLHERQLTILVSNGQGGSFTIDGSNNPASILEANVKQLNLPLNQVWQEGEEREFTFVYSACGCPVKVKCRREGNRTVRTSDSPVMFPDDAPVVQIISRLMGW